MVRISLLRLGRKKRPYYKIVVSHAGRASNFKEAIGYYDPLLTCNNLYIEMERFNYWLSKGAQVTKSLYDLKHKYL
jgi:small subunit ribosomal protein S16